MFAQLTEMYTKQLALASIGEKNRCLIHIILCTILLLPFSLTSCTDCERRDYDSDFNETIVRDHTDESYGALSNGTVRPLGGGEGYPRIVDRPSPITETTPFAVVVHSADQLRAALQINIDLHRTIYIDDDAEIDLSYCARIPTPSGCSDPRAGPEPENCDEYSLTIPPNVTLASGRGRDGSRGALLYSHTFSDCPLLKVNGPGVRISGLRIHGPDSSIENDDPIHCPEAVGIGIINGTLALWETEVDNNELSAWPDSSILISRVRGVYVHHNVIQYNRRHEHNGTCDHDYGLGYGVVVGPGSAIIEANVFDHNRHDIASGGAPGSYYTARYNLVLTGAVEQSFDVHGGKDRNDCTDIAGSAFVIHHNTFLQSHKPAVLIRGVPTIGAWIYNNETHDDDVGHAFEQSNADGNFIVDNNMMNIDKFPAWFISFEGSTFWQWRQFESQSMSGVVASDFDGDGAADVMRSTSTGWQWSKSGRLGWAFLNTLTDPVSQLAFGDFIGYPFTDVIRATGNEWQISEGGTSEWQSLYNTNMSLSNAMFGDFGGDDRTDAFFTDGTQWTIIESFLPTVVRRHFNQPYTLSELRFGNFVGDSKMDILRWTGDDWLVWDMASRAWNYLGSSQIPISELTFADFDGDGFTDIARNDDGQWLVSWAGRSLWQVLNTSDSQLREQLIADFNGDGKADVLSQQSPDP